MTLKLHHRDHVTPKFPSRATIKSTLGRVPGRKASLCSLRLVTAPDRLVHVETISNSRLRADKIGSVTARTIGKPGWIKDNREGTVLTRETSPLLSVDFSLSTFSITFSSFLSNDKCWTAKVSRRGDYNGSENGNYVLTICNWSFERCWNFSCCRILDDRIFSPSDGGPRRELQF